MIPTRSPDGARPSGRPQPPLDAHLMVYIFGGSTKTDRAATAVVGCQGVHQDLPGSWPPSRADSDGCSPRSVSTTFSLTGVEGIGPSCHRHALGHRPWLRRRRDNERRSAQLIRVFG